MQQTKKVKQSPHQKCSFTDGPLLLLQCIDTSVVIYRAAWCILQPQYQKIKIFSYLKKHTHTKILIFRGIELSNHKLSKLLYFSQKHFVILRGREPFSLKSKNNKDGLFQRGYLSRHERNPENSRLTAD